MFSSRRFAFLALLILPLLPLRAAAFSSGFTGRSGKDGLICSQCHQGGSEPLVRFEGPRQVAAGAIVTYRFVVQSQSPAQTHAGLNVAASDGELTASVDLQVQALAGELTHTSPKPNDSQGIASFEFAWTAPSTLGEQTLFGAGNSVNRNRSSSGDGAAASTLSVQVVGATSCGGDCSRDGEVSIDELVLTVNIATQNNAVTVCLAADGNGDGSVGIDELVSAIESALAGCTP